MKTGLNIGSGQRRFTSTPDVVWNNIDCVSREGQVPDVLCDVGKEELPYIDGSIDYVVLHQVYEHFGLGEGHGVIKEAHRVLRDGGSLIITLPDIEALFHRWQKKQITDYIFFVNVYGAYQGHEGDRHKWAYTFDSLKADFQNIPCVWSDFNRFDWRLIPGADIARDWWVLAVETVK